MMKLLLNFIVLLPLSLVAQNTNTTTIDSFMQVHAKAGFSGVLLVAGHAASQSYEKNLQSGFL